MNMMTFLLCCSSALIGISRGEILSLQANAREQVDTSEVPTSAADDHSPYEIRRTARAFPEFFNAASVGESPLFGEALPEEPVLRRTPGATEAAHRCAQATLLPFVLINMDRRTDRLEEIEKTLPSWICEKACRIPAVDSNSKLTTRPDYISERDWIEAHTRAKEKIKTVGGSLTPGGIGLLMSSHKVWEYIVASGVQTVVMEDDINVTHPAELLDALCDLATRGDWEFVQFQSDNAATDPHPPLVEIGNVATTAPTMKRGMGFNTGMYAVTPWAAERLLDSLNNGTHKQLDDLDGVLRTTIRKAFHFWPPLANQTDIGRGSSDVQIRGQSHTQEPMRASCKIKKC